MKYPVLYGWSDHGESAGMGMWHLGVRTEFHTRFWWETLKDIGPLERTRYTLIKWMYKKTSNVATYNVTLRRFRVTIAAVENQ